MIRGGWNDIFRISQIASLELDFLVSNCPETVYIEAVLGFIEETVASGPQETLAQFSNMQMNMKIKSILALKHKNITKSIGTRLVTMGRQITKGVT